MSTLAQIEANRLNALASSGPVTALGKSISSQNARKHGLYATVDHLNEFEREAYDEILAQKSDHYQPVSPEEQALVSEIALAWFRIFRVRTMENGFFHCAIDALVESGEVDRPQTHEEYGGLYGRVYYHDASSARALYKLFSIECRLVRQQEKAQKRLEALIEARRPDPPPAANKATSTKLASFHQKPAPSPACIPDDLPRNAACPCGSGKKYKRCCGQDAKPHYNL